jgi:ribosome-binding ATPase YchF (GTP1/OBG family)
LLTIAIVGKTNTGKTTLFNAATLLNAKISNFPFTTKEPNVGVAYACDNCVCRELGVTDNPLNSTCIEGWRYVPVRIIDVPGLIKDAWSGKGLGTQFLSVIGQADALIHVVDASGSIDAEGKITKPGSGNPVQDAVDVEMELNRWIADILEHNRPFIIREAAASSLEEAITRSLSGIKVNPSQVLQALEKSQLQNVPFAKWYLSQTIKFAAFLLPIIKPTLILANKVDILTSDHYLELLHDYYGRSLVAACSAEAELVLRRAEKAGLLRYTPGEEKFVIKQNAKLTPTQEGALNYVQTRVMAKWMRTGIQQALNTVVFKLLKMNMVYPVYDETKFLDHHGNVLPDVYLMQDGSTPIDLAKSIHTTLLENYVVAIDARTGIRLPEDYHLRHKDIIKIMTSKRSRQHN